MRGSFQGFRGVANVNQNAGANSGLQKDLDKLGFNLIGYGCTTCIGNSGPLAEPISDCIRQNDLVACSVLSGNRNFEGRVNPDVKVGDKLLP